MLDQIFFMALPFILMAVALALDSTIFGFFGGISAIFVSFTLLNVIWAMMIFLGLGLYFILMSVLVELEEQ